ncbi:DNA-binding transcriptional regulator DsdC, partial [Salmonella enterica subsp. enterica serovar Kentucky]
CLMDAAIVPDCTPDPARRYASQDNLTHLRYCTLLHDRQAWSNESGPAEWHRWAQHFAVNLPHSSGIGVDRSELAVIAAMNHIGEAMGRKRLVHKRLDSGELIAPGGDIWMNCHQHYYVSTLPGRPWPKIEAWIR